MLLTAMHVLPLLGCASVLRSAQCSRLPRTLSISNRDRGINHKCGQIIKPEKNFDVPDGNGIWCNRASESVELAITMNNLRCPNVHTHLEVTLHISCLCCFSPSLSQQQYHSPVTLRTIFHSPVSMINHTALQKLTSVSAACHFCLMI